MDVTLARHRERYAAALERALNSAVQREIGR